MSRDNVAELVRRLESGAITVEDSTDGPTSADIISLGEAHGLAFSEDDLGGYLRTLIVNAESLPRPWGWAIARQLGLVRS
mgnify:CR=1 FL=1|jgi:hypothetical protein